MPAALANYQWELDDYVFGEGCVIDHEPTVDPGSYSITNTDSPIPGHDGLVPGQDTFQPDTWNFLLFTNTESENDALAALSAIGGVWRADQYRGDVGAVTGLRYCINSRTRVVYGRPRRFSAPLDATFHGGQVKITADFQRVSELYFDDAEDSFDVHIGEPAGGGFMTPVIPPITVSNPNAESMGDFFVDSLMPVFAVFEFHGPSSGAYIDIDGQWRVELTGDVPDGETLLVDTRPWSIGATWKSTGAGAGNILARRTRLANLRLQPGAHTATMGGTDPLGTSFGRVRWQKVYPTI